MLTVSSSFTGSVYLVVVAVLVVVVALVVATVIES